MTISFITRAAILILFLALGDSTAATTQQNQQSIEQWERPSITELLERFTAEVLRATPSRGVILSIDHIIYYAYEFPAPVVDSLLVGLENLILTSPNEYVRSSALTKLSLFGMVATNAGLQIPTRLKHVYGRTDDPVVRDLVIAHMVRQVDRAAAAQVLREIVQRDTMAVPGFHHGSSPSIHAIHILQLLGEPGHRALRELHESGQVRDPRAPKP
jgi:hypothetical protein